MNMPINTLGQYAPDVLQDNGNEHLESLDRYEDQYTSCRNPGKNGCQHCDACADWGDQTYHYRKENGWQ